MIELDIDIDTSQLDAAKYDRAIRKKLQDGMEFGMNVAHEKAPEDRGTMKASRIDPEWRGNTLVAGYASPYAEAQEFGTEPFTPPLQPLLEWGDRVFNTERSANEVLQDLEENGWHPGIFAHPGAAVWSKIRENGIQEKRFLRDGSDAAKDYLQGHDTSQYFDRE